MELQGFWMDVGQPADFLTGEFHNGNFFGDLFFFQECVSTSRPWVKNPAPCCQRDPVLLEMSL